MSDVLTNLWINIDSFYYPKEISKIDPKDIELFHKANVNFLVKPTIVLLITLYVRRNRNKLYHSFKLNLLGERVKSERIVQITPKPEKIKQFNDYQDTISITNSRTLRSRRNVEGNTEPEVINIPLKNPTFSEEYGGFLRNQKENVYKLSSLKRIFSRQKTSDQFKSEAENYLLNSKLIFLPFIMVLFIYGYDLGITYFGFYLKYQPLVDEFYNQKYKL